ncbi:MAG: hypothetical protein D8H99_51835 [Streptococcus sp.]|nr:MAG: hypothetical protein D8H99_51835 [Streptococcus sp.]
MNTLFSYILEALHQNTIILENAYHQQEEKLILIQHALEEQFPGIEITIENALEEQIRVHTEQGQHDIWLADFVEVEDLFDKLEQIQKGK